MARKINEIREMNKEDLDKRIDELKKELMKVNAQRATKSSMKNPEQIKAIKKTIARILTIKNQKINEVIEKHG